MDAQPGSIHEAAARGDADAVRRLVKADSACATVKDRHGWDALTHLCFSKVLATDRSRAVSFCDAARALLDAGASANTGYNDHAHQPPVFESVLYGAAGIAHCAPLTRLLLERGADPNDESCEVPYHAPESYDNGCVDALIASGRLSDDSLAIMLLRKCDWHDVDGIRLLLESGADPNRQTRWGYTAFHQALRRDNDIDIITLLLDHGADPAIIGHAQSGTSMAAWAGRGDVLNVLAHRGVAIDLLGIDRLVAACVCGDSERIRSLVSAEPSLAASLLSRQGDVLRTFAGVGNVDGLKHLFDLGANIGTAVTFPDGYWGIAKTSTPLHVAAWRARHAAVKLLIERRADVNARDGKAQTPLMLAVRACVDSHWKERRAPESVAALLAAGASRSGISVPTGYEEIDVLLRPGR